MNFRSLDNLPAHKVAGVKQAIEAAGATRLLLPPYSPDFNPIEQAFSKLKALLRKAAARTVDDLWAAIAEIIELFTPTECANFFVNSGYDPEFGKCSSGSSSSSVEPVPLRGEVPASDCAGEYILPLGMIHVSNTG